MAKGSLSGSALRVMIFSVGRLTSHSARFGGRTKELEMNPFGIIGGFTNDWQCLPIRHVLIPNCPAWLLSRRFTEQELLQYNIRWQDYQTFVSCEGRP